VTGKASAMLTFYAGNCALIAGNLGLAEARYRNALAGLVMFQAPGVTASRRRST